MFHIKRNAAISLVDVLLIRTQKAQLSVYSCLFFGVHEIKRKLYYRTVGEKKGQVCFFN